MSVVNLESGRRYTPNNYIEEPVGDIVWARYVGYMSLQKDLSRQEVITVAERRRIEKDAAARVGGQLLGTLEKSYVDDRKVESVIFFARIFFTEIHGISDTKLDRQVKMLRRINRI